MEPSDLYELIYTSTMARHAELKEIATISRKAHVDNAARCVTGILVFDGERFCEHMEGPKAVVMSLFEHIRTDSRHTDVTVLHQGEITNRRFRSFTLGFADVMDPEEMSDLAKLRGPAASSAFHEIVRRVDISP